MCFNDFASNLREKQIFGAVLIEVIPEQVNDRQFYMFLFLKLTEINFLQIIVEKHTIISFLSYNKKYDQTYLV